MRSLWAGGPDGVTHHGEFFDFDEVCIYPKPVAGEVPLHVGGSSRGAARRADARGGGYFADGMLTPAERIDQLELMRQAAADTGRDPDEIQSTRWGSIDIDRAKVDAYAQEGVDPSSCLRQPARWRTELPN